MKLILTSLLFIFNLLLSAQSNQLAGNYSHSLGENEKHKLEYQLTLNQDGTFVFHYYSKIENRTPLEENKYGKGKWTAKDNVVTFSADKKEDLDEKYTLDFNNSAARFVTKNPRDKSDKIVQTRLKFLDSGIFWMKGIDVFKI
ncbi:hypothetical protein [Flavobacterium sp.]|uniref:hypothetical protein n=1 Tax=Flavobacterium sp. TaxID=239 RepID=UPI002EDAA9EE